MSVSRRVRKYMTERFTEVMHTTLNPQGPGVVRIHLIPPVSEGKEVAPSIVILNGQDIIPVNYSWAIVLAELIKEINRYAGREVSDGEVSSIIKNTCKATAKVFPFVNRKKVEDDIRTMMDTFKQVAYGEPVTAEIGYLNIGDYAPFMKAPHRMDLMVSAMTKEGYWHCNQKCVHCYAAGQVHSEEAELSTEEWKRILDKCRQAGITQVTFTGGEPTMREDLPELIAYAKWFVSRLNTNGIRLTKEFCAALSKAELDSMQITFYSSKPEIHNALVGAERFEDTVAGIKNALEAGHNVSINTPLCTTNRDYVETLKFLHELGIRYVTCSGLITTGNATGEASEKLQLTTEEIKTILADAAEYCYANDMEISFTSPGWIEPEFFEEHALTTPNCGACLSNMAVTPGGNVVPCQSWLSQDVLGNMLSDDWDTIWNSEKAKVRREYSAKMLGKCPLRREK